MQTPVVSWAARPGELLAREAWSPVGVGVGVHAEALPSTARANAAQGCPECRAVRMEKQTQHLLERALGSCRSETGASRAAWAAAPCCFISRSPNPAGGFSVAIFVTSYVHLGSDLGLQQLES